MTVSTNAVRLGMIAVAVFRATAQEPAPPVYFNHTTLFLTPATYDAFKSSPLLKDEFSASAERTTQANGGQLSYTGIVLDGAHTYLELMQAGPSPFSPTTMIPEGRVDVGMWIDHRTLLPILRDRIGLEILTRRDEQNQPSFDFLTTPLDTKRGVETWVSAHYPDGKTRDRRRYQPDRLFHDVVAYTVTVGVEEREKLLRWFRAYGYTIREDGEKRIATGPEFTFTMLPEPAKGPRTATIEMTLNREKTGQQRYSIGDSELKFNKDRATLTFRFPKQN